MKFNKNKVVITLVCALGVSAVAYGMMSRSHPVFIAGLVLVIVGYLLIRKKLKLTTEDTESIQRIRA
ncbi:MAG: hypothetical protein GY864_07595 [Desulfobacterales bacterium]|nr:hypothetical protein [Desulfobacterales bacterium]